MTKYCESDTDPPETVGDDLAALKVVFVLLTDSIR